MKIKTKYNGTIDAKIYFEYCVNSIFKILPMMEEEKEWERYLEGLLVELNGLDSLSEEINFICLIGKLEGLLATNSNFNDSENKQIFRKIIFDSIDLVKKLSPVELEG